MRNEMNKLKQVSSSLTKRINKRVKTKTKPKSSPKIRSLQSIRFGSALPGPADIEPADVAYRKWAIALVNPWDRDANGARATTRTLVPTETYYLNETATLNSYSTSTTGSYDRGGAAVFYGSGHETGRDNITISATGVPNFTLGDTYSNGVENEESAASERILGCGQRFTYTSIGVDHGIKLHAMPLEPDVLPITAIPTNFPSNIALSPNQTQIRRGARTIEMKSGDSVCLLALPTEEKSLEFIDATISRQYFSYSGWVVWWWGMNLGDTMQINQAYVSDYFRYQNSTRSPANPAFVEANTMLVDKVFASTARMIATGHDCVIVRGGKTTPAPFPYGQNGARAAPYRAFRSLFTDPKSDNKITLSNKTTNNRSNSSSSSSLNIDESKDIEDLPVVITPKNARRPSIARSLR